MSRQPLIAADHQPAPSVNTMNRIDYEPYLETTPGLLIHEKLFRSQVLCGGCEKKTVFSSGVWYPQMPLRLDDKDFKAALSPSILEFREESACLCRCCGQFRELQLGVFAPGLSEERSGWPEGEAPMLILDRPFRCSLPCCCCLLYAPEVSVVDGRTGQLISRAVFDWKWYNCCWPCMQHLHVEDSFHNVQHVVITPRACGNCCQNCCAPTCFRPTFTSTIFDATGTIPMGVMENQWPGCNAADNYVLKFPENASPPQKAGLLAALFLNNYLYFEIC